jgi:hypothetical protein
MTTNTSTIALGRRIQKIRSARRAIHQSDRKTIRAHRQAEILTPEYQKIPGGAQVAAEIKNHQLVTQRKRLEDVEPIAALRWLLRKYFAWRGFACRYHCGQCDGKCYASIEYRGTFEDPVDAYWAANCPGGAVKPIPFNAPLPEETVSHGAGDVPQSEASSWYRKGVLLPFVAVPREKLERLEEKIRATDNIVEAFRAKAV